MIDELIKYQVIDLNKLVLKIYPRLGLLPQEGVMLLHLISFYQQNNQQKCFPLSYIALRNKTGLDKKENGLIIQSLIEKGFIDLTLEKKNNDKEQQYVNISNVFIQIEELLKKDKEEELNKQITNNLKETYELFERELGRQLNHVEASMLEEYNHLYTKDNYENAIYEVSSKKNLTVKACIDYLKTNHFMKQEVNKEDEESIRSFIASINKRA